MSNFFIHRPVFAWVLAIIMMIAGGLAILQLPIAQYPTIAPPAVAISATYPGADAQTVQDTSPRLSSRIERHRQPDVYVVDQPTLPVR
ncbi:RND efflux system [Klebsiella pneumoniae]|uniref:RND efflux system n=1 Tax=Klebsiella pneumoniae TaxID=573 RepID=A0A377U3I4_KLEPN|nr:RND efflux system [Klebsiella pneumoniae]